MEKGLVELGLQIYQVAGIIGVMAFLLILAVSVIIGFHVRLSRRQAKEIEEARQEVKQIQKDMTASLKEMLDECEKSCLAKDAMIEEHRRQIETYRRNEIFLQNEIAALQARVKILEEELP